MKQINTTQKRGVYNITGIMKPELRADDDDIWCMQETMSEHGIRPDAWQMQKKHMIRSEESSKKAEMRPNMKQLRKLMHDCMTLSDNEIEDIASSEEENEKLYTRMDGSGKAISTDKPVLKKSSDQESDKDWKPFDSFDKEYST